MEIKNWNEELSYNMGDKIWVTAILSVKEELRAEIIDTLPNEDNNDYKIQYIDETSLQNGNYNGEDKRSESSILRGVNDNGD